MNKKIKMDLEKITLKEGTKLITKGKAMTFIHGGYLALMINKENKIYLQVQDYFYRVHRSSFIKLAKEYNKKEEKYI